MSEFSNSNKFFSLSLELGALIFGDFKLKSGLNSPYFFNMSALFGGGAIYELADLYSNLILEKEIDFDIIFGPAYKGIPLASAISSILYNKTKKRIPICFDRKELKDHGEGGNFIGAELDGRVLIVDDVLTVGTALRSSVKKTLDSGGMIEAAIIGLDREEIITDLPVKKTLIRDLGFPIYSIAKVSDLLRFLEEDKQYSEQAALLKSSLKI
ncbi:MAG: orotate phosphoribosyltransferase [SAR86 cluster bacterium]|nr:orotate phosphoribosyltransferase [SAR86 cluster bacterium]